VTRGVLSGKIEWADLEIGCMGRSLFLEAVAPRLGSCIFANIAGESSPTLSASRKTRSCGSPRL
jgi:hypothetical protein